MFLWLEGLADFFVDGESDGNWHGGRGGALVYDVVGEFGGVPVEGVGFDFGCGYEVVGDGADVLFRWGVRGAEGQGVCSFVGPVVSEFEEERVGVVERWIEGVHWRAFVGAI